MSHTPECPTHCSQSVQNSQSTPGLWTLRCFSQRKNCLFQRLTGISSKKSSHQADDMVPSPCCGSIPTMDVMSLPNEAISFESGWLFFQRNEVLVTVLSESDGSLGCQGKGWLVGLAPAPTVSATTNQLATNLLATNPSNLSAAATKTSVITRSCSGSTSLG